MCSIGIQHTSSRHRQSCKAGSGVWSRLGSGAPGAPGIWVACVKPASVVYQMCMRIQYATTGSLLCPDIWPASKGLCVNVRIHSNKSSGTGSALEKIPKVVIACSAVNTAMYLQ